MLCLEFYSNEVKTYNFNLNDVLNTIRSPHCRHNTCSSQPPTAAFPPPRHHSIRRLAGDASSSHISHIFAAEQNVNDNCDPEIRNHRKLEWCGPAPWWRCDIASIISFFKQKTSFLHIQNISLVFIQNTSFLHTSSSTRPRTLRHQDTAVKHQAGGVKVPAHRQGRKYSGVRNSGCFRQWQEHGQSCECGECLIPATGT